MVFGLELTFFAITKRIIAELRHGGTLINEVGVFTQKERKLLLVVVHNQQINHLPQIVHETYQAIGEGFVPIGRIIKSEKQRSKQNRPKR